MLTDKQRNQLKHIARDSIIHGLDKGRPLHIDIKQYDNDLVQKRATFVTLQSNQQLRGCIGILEPLRPLVEDVAHNAYAAAFSDRRFTPVTRDEMDDLDIHISILGTPEGMDFGSEEDLVNQLRPGVDGLILEDRQHKGTFLPSVWQSLPDRREFLQHLKQKAGLPFDYWSDTINIMRYTVEEF